ncbi:MAG: 50S ribosomal protein L21 [Acidobacteriota bacterium]
MFAVIETGGKQYRVQKGDLIDVERLEGVSPDDPAVTFGRVLMVGGDDNVRVGAPALDGVTVTGTLLREVRGPKVLVFKFKRRKQYRRKNGHRQNYHRVRIEAIEG